VLAVDLFLIYSRGRCSICVRGSHLSCSHMSCNRGRSLSCALDAAVIAGRTLLLLQEIDVVIW